MGLLARALRDASLGRGRNWEDNCENIQNIIHLHVVGSGTSLPSSGLIPRSFSTVSDTQAIPNESLLVEAVKSCRCRRVYLQIMT
jgi:hypothetical protein